MSHYQYTITKQNKPDEQYFIFGNIVHQEILESLLEEKRTKRLHKFLQSQDPNSIDNIDQLREQMASLNDIIEKYTISNIIKIECEGCVYGHPAQKEHMTCPTGCLHDHTYCSQ